MPLRPGVADVFLRAFSQVQGDRSGPTGRLTDLKNAVVTHYDPGNGQPQRIKVQQRNGFATLTTEGHSSTSGAPVTPSWTNPELLSTLGSQLLSIANAIPRVYDGTDWTHYADERVVPNQLSETVFHTSQRTLLVDDSAWKGGVTCSVWIELTSPAATPIIYAGFKADDGTWVKPPKILYDPAANDDALFTFAKVVADKEDDFFWVVFNRLSDGTPKIEAALFNLDGLQVDNVEVDQPYSIPEPGYWDIVATDIGGCLLAQPLHAAVDVTDGVKLTQFFQASGTITPTTTDLPDVHCRGPLAWMTNDLADGFQYLATIGDADGETTRLWGYQIEEDTDNATHEYDFDVNSAGDPPDSMIGYASTPGDPDEPSMTVSFQNLSNGTQSSGPVHDPQLRFSKCYTCTWADAVTFERQNDFTLQVSRAFKHDDEYYGINYYQSGSGNLISSTSIQVDFTPGDYMIGSQLQKVTVTPNIDYTAGSARTFPTQPSHLIHITEAFANTPIPGSSTVEVITSGNDLYPRGVPVGTTVLRWTFSTYTPTDPTLVTGGRLVIAGSSGVTNADGTWDVLGTDATGAFPNSIYTPVSSILGVSLSPGTFGAAGTFQVDSMALYHIIEICTAYDGTTRGFLLGGSMVVAGNPTSANNGTKTIARAITSNDPNNGQTFGYGAGIWITRGTESNSTGGFSAVLTPTLVRQWSFDAVSFDDALLVGPHTLVVEEDSFGLPGSGPPLNTPETQANNSSTGDGYAITDIPSVHVVETDGDAITAEFFDGTETINLRVPDDVTQYTFFLQDLDVTYDLKGAYLIVTSDTFQSVNNAVFVISDIDPDPTHHIVYCTPTDGRSDFRSQMFYPDDQNITIVQQTNVQPEYQPCWLMVPLTGTKPVVGRWEYGIAYADWRYDGAESPARTNNYPLGVTSVVRRTSDFSVVLPYRAVSFTVGQTIVTTSGQVVNAAIASNASTVGLKQFILSDSPGLSTVSSAAMLLPGPMCGEFTASGFHENGVNFGLEAPFVVSQQESDTGTGLRKGGVYQLVAVAEVTDENGDRVFSIVSPPLNFQMNGDNNSITYGGRLLQPLDSDGVPVAQHFGVTNHRLLSISLYRTAYQDDVPTTERHKITLDLQANGLAPISDTNDSGFSFPTEFTWNYLDENIDAAILPAEVCYIDKGYLPRFPAPAQRCGVFWKDRSWVIGYDGAVWMSGEKKEGDATWFFPLFRFVLPTTDSPVALAEMDDYLLVLCAKSIWYIPSTTFPNATGRNGSLPAPVQLPFTNGCTGHAITLHAGVAYSSTAGGVWLITRSLENRWLSQQVQDKMELLPITGMAVDKRQRLHVSTLGSLWFVYDQVVQNWSWWNPPTSGAHFPTILDGEVAFEDNSHVWLYDPETFCDHLEETLVGIDMDITIASIQFSNVRGLKSVWEMQIVGTYKGEHHINAVLSYPDDDPDNPTVFPDPADGPYTPDPDLPYLLAINPMIEQASSYGLRIFADFDGIETPGDSFELELVSCEVGLDSSVGVNKFPDNRRLSGV